ncbi:MAG: dTMP kinase [Spirochaetia bacterium]|nr:dTMP kinase [Spirochaetia bacterium]
MSDAPRILTGFVVFEGIDGSGTSTQLRVLDARLSGLGIPHTVSAEPTDGPIGKLIRDALAGRTPLLPETVARLFAADRDEHLRSTGGILDTLAQGGLAISDRYIFSSLAYQGLTCGRDFPRFQNAAFPLPELVVYFDVRTDTSMSRMAGRHALDIYENRDFQDRVADEYRAVLDSYASSGVAIVRVDASLPVDLVSEAVWAAVHPVAGRLLRPGTT